MEKNGYRRKMSFYSALLILFGILLSPVPYLHAEEIPYGTGTWDADSLEY